MFVYKKYKINGAVAHFLGQSKKCSGAMCMMHCENGFQIGSDGCEICKCKQGMSSKFSLHFFVLVLLVIFVGPLISPFWTSGVVCLCLCASSPACSGFLRFTSSATPADLIIARTTTEPFLVHVFVLVDRMCTFSTVQEIRKIRSHQNKLSPLTSI